MNRAVSVNRAHSLASDQEINDGMAEIELHKLQRQYRIMEGDRKAYSEESRQLISNQRSSIDKLKRDKAFLLEELKLLEQRDEESKRDGTASKKAEELGEQAEYYDKRIRATVQEISEMDVQINQLDQRIAKQRQEMGGVNAATMTSLGIQKQIRILENRLDKSLVKFNKALAVNKRLRETIDNLRRERSVFDNIYRKFERELLDQKKTMAEIIEASNSAYEARDEAQAKIIAMKEKAEKEYQAYTQEIKELDRLLEQDRKLKEFMATKSSDRAENGGEGTHGSARHPIKDKSEMFGKGSQDAIFETMETYEAAFHRIRQVTGISDLGELVTRFKEVEDQNFSLFNYVNEVNNEIEKMAEKIVEVDERIKKFKEEGVLVDDHRRAVMKDLEAKLSACNQRCEQYDKQYSETTFVLETIRRGVEKLVQTINEAAKTQAAARRQVTEGAGPSSSEEDPPFFNFGTDLTGGTVNLSDHKDDKGKDAVGTITDANLLHYLSVIEQRTNELLIANFVTALPKRVGGVDEKDATGATPASMPSTGSVVALGLVGAQQTSIGGLLGQGPTAPVGNITILAPSTGDEHETDEWVSEEDDRPLSREELTQMTLRGLSKREKMGPIVSAVKTAKSKRRERV